MSMESTALNFFASNVSCLAQQIPLYYIALVLRSTTNRSILHAR